MWYLLKSGSFCTKHCFWMLHMPTCNHLSVGSPINWCSGKYSYATLWSFPRRHWRLWWIFLTVIFQISLVPWIFIFIFVLVMPSLWFLVSSVKSSRFFRYLCPYILKKFRICHFLADISLCILPFWIILRLYRFLSQYCMKFIDGF